jgi:hypothetical protein
MARDFYAEAERIADDLTSEGLVAEADDLRNVIVTGSTATEILMGVRWHLQNIDRTNKTANVSTKRKIRELLAELNQVLA